MRCPKIVACFTLLVLFSLSASSQYVLSVKHQPYQQLSGPVAISPALTWYQFNEEIALTFPLSIFDVSGTSNLVTNLGLYLYSEDGQTISIATPYFIPNNELTDIGTDSGVAGSVVSYVTEGEPGERILKIEYRDLAFENSTLNDTVNFQIWYFEKDQAIEYHYGRCTVNSPGMYHRPGITPILGRIDFTNDAIKYLIPSGNLENPQLVTIEEYDDNTVPYVEGTPTEGLVYRFAPGESSVSTHKSNQDQVFPSPFRDELFISAEVEKVKISSVDGRMQKELAVAKNGAVEGVAKLPAGIYFIQLPQAVVRVVKL